MCMEEINQNEATWVGSKDCHVCYYNSGVDCDDFKDCAWCGWNPFVSLARIVEKYGQKAGDYLTKPGD